MKKNIGLIEYFVRKFLTIKTKIENNISLTCFEERLYEILDEYDFYAPEYIRNIKSNNK